VDSGFSSTLKGAVGTLNSLSSKLSGFSFGVLSGIGQSVFNTVSSSVKSLAGEAISASDSMQKLQQAMRFSGTSEAEIERIAGSTGTLKTYADKTVFSLEDVMSTFGALSANGVKDADKLTESVGNAVAVFGGGAQEFSSVALAFSQSMAAGKMNAQDWNQVLNASPQLAGGLKKELQKLSPVLAKDFKKGMEKGAISADLLAQAMNNIGMTEMAKEAASSVTTWEGAMGNLEATVQSGIMTLYDSFAKSGLISVVNSFNDKLGGVFAWLGEAIPAAIKKAQPYFETLKNAVGKMGELFNRLSQRYGPAFNALKENVGKAMESVRAAIDKIDVDTLERKIATFIYKVKPYWEAIKSVILAVAGAIAKVLPYIVKVGKAIGSFFLDNSARIAKFIPYIAGAIGAFKGFKLVKGLFGKASSAVDGASEKIGGGLSKIAQIINSVGDLFKSVGVGISTAASGIGNGIKAVFTGIGKALQLANPANILALGAAVAIAAIGFTFLAQEGEGVATILEGIGSVVESVGAALSGIISTAIKAIAEALVILAPVMPIIAASLVMLTPLVKAFGVAFSMLARAIGKAISDIVVGISEGIARIIEALTPIVEIISNLITDIVSIWVDAAVRIVEAIAPILPAFTEAFTKITVVVSNAIVSIIEILAPYIPEITKMVEATSQAIQSICEAFTTLVEQIVPVIESVTELVKQLGSTLTEILGGASELVTAFGDTISQVVESIGSAISGVIDSVAGVFDSMGEAALNAGKGFEHLANGVKTITKLNLIDMAASMGAVALALGDLVKKSKGIADAGKGMSDLAKGLKTASKTGADDLESLGDAAESMVKTMSTAFTAGALVAQTTGQLIGTNFTNGAAKGFAQAPAMATASIVAVNAALLAGAARAYQAGAFISIGFANGMRSKLGEIRSAAAQMAVAAQKALEAKAKIDSPSKVTTKDGQWWGQGYANGMMDKVRTVRKAAEKLVSVPQVATPRLAMAYGGELVEDYSYSNSAEYIITVPVAVDGKEVARVTAPYYQAELSRRETRDSRKKGKV
jgi:tape measure domain-containing protein